MPAAKKTAAKKSTRKVSDKNGKPVKPKQDKKALKLMKKINTLVDRYLKRVAKKGKKNNIRFTDGTSISNDVRDLLKDEQYGWFDL